VLQAQLVLQENQVLLVLRAPTVHQVDQAKMANQEAQVPLEMPVPQVPLANQVLQAPQATMELLVPQALALTAHRLVWLRAIKRKPRLTISWSTKLHTTCICLFCSVIRKIFSTTKEFY